MFLYCDCQRLTERRTNNNCNGSAGNMAGYCFVDFRRTNTFSVAC